MQYKLRLVVVVGSLLGTLLGLAAGCGPTQPTGDTTPAPAAQPDKPAPKDPGAGTRGAGGIPETPDLPPGDGQRVALLVGVDRYEGTGLRNLEYAEKDVTDLNGLLTTLGYRVTLMTRAEFKRLDKDFLLPTAANVRDQLGALTRERKPGDVVLVAFSGHGAHLKRTDKLYYCPTGANLEKEDTLVAIDDVLTTLKGCTAGRKIVVVDACRNEPGDGRQGGTPDELMSATRPLIPDLPGGTLALFSCSKGQIAYESGDHKRGFLFHYVIEGLGGKAANKSGQVTWLGLADYVGAEVPDAVRREKGPRAAQTPEVKGEIRGPVVLAKYAVAPVTLPPQPTKLLDGEAIQGDWRITYFEEQGEVIPPEMFKTMIYTFANGEFTLKLDGKAVVAGKYTLDATKTPSHINLKADGEDMPGIYKLDGDTLILCQPALQRNHERPKEFNAPKNSRLMLMKLERVKK